MALMTRRQISNNDDIVDSRDILDRIRELEDELEEPDEDHCYGCGLRLVGDDGPGDGSVIEEGHEYHVECLGDRYDDMLDCEKEELDELQAVIDEISRPRDGHTMIRDSYFTEYAEQFADDIGAINSNAGWPLYYIDWDEAADALKMDYTSVEWGGVTYWVSQ